LILRELLRPGSLRSRYRRARAVVGWMRWRWRKRLEYRDAVRRSVERASPPVLVYQMAKVGSSTITAALRSVGGLSVFQVHVMNPDTIRRLRTRLRGMGTALLRTDTDILGRSLFKGLIEPGLKAKVITLVREPIGRNFSFYFHNLDVLWATADAHENVEMGRLVGEFHDRFDSRRALEWFDTEFKPVLGVDIYEHEFPRDKKHLRIQTERYDILVMRSDLDDASKAKCVEGLLGIEGLSLVPTNVGSQKPYAATYRKFLEAVALPESYVNDLLGSKFTRHFFGPEEIESLRVRWLSKSASNQGGGRSRLKSQALT
jgi:hypothetical protein